MRLRNPMAFYLIGALALFSGASALSQEKPDDEQSTNTWNTMILGFLQPETVNIRAYRIYTETAAPQDRVWLIVGAELTPPDTGTMLEGKEINIIDGEGNLCPLISIYKYSESGNAPYDYLDHPDGMAIYEGGSVLWEVENSIITFQTTDPVKVNLLFAVPPALESWSLRIGEDEPIAPPPPEPGS